MYSVDLFRPEKYSHDVLVVDEAVLVILVKNAPLPTARHYVAEAVVSFDTKF